MRWRQHRVRDDVVSELSLLFVLLFIRVFRIFLLDTAIACLLYCIPQQKAHKNMIYEA